MRAKWPILAVVVVLGSGYLGYPYVTLYRLGIAMRTSDAATLRSLVDWYAVREGLKEDICDMILDEPPNAPPNTELAPFGASFVRGMTGNILNQMITPEAFASMSRIPADKRRAEPTLAWAFFDTPTRFSIALRTDGSAEPIRIRMELHDMMWQVRRIWLPDEMLELAGSRT